MIPAGRRRLCLACAALVIDLAATATSFAAPKTDVVVLANGDRITGEVKKLERGLLTLKTDALGTVAIEWPRVAKVETKQLLDVEGSDHQRHFGTLAGVDGGGNLLLAPKDGGPPVALPMADLVQITPLSEGGWLDRTEGRLSVGLNAASANDNRQFTVSAGLDYRDETRAFDTSYFGSLAKSAHNPEARQQNLDAEYRWLPNRRRFWVVTGSVTTNDELDLDLRSLVGAGAGRYWLRDSQHELGGFIGLVATREHYGDQGRQYQLEGVLQGNYDLFRFDSPKIDVSMQMALYPSLSTSGRLRSEWSVQARIELIKDLYYELSYLRSQDNKSPGGAGRLVDWSLVSSLGYKF